jgi:phospholipase/carboxylesterase
MQAKKAQYFISFLFLYLGLQTGCAEPEQKASPEPVEQPQKLLDYVETTTAGAAANASLPLIIAVHGLGDTPANFKRILGDINFQARIIIPRAPIKWHVGFAWFTTRIASGQWDALSKGIESAAELVSKLIIHIAKKVPTKGKPALWGFSQGGMISFAVAVNHPKIVGLSIPIGGMLPQQLWPKTKKPQIAYPPIRALHGEADDLVPIKLCRDTVERLKALGFDAELQSYPGVPHSIDEKMHRDLVELLRDTTN